MALSIQTAQAVVEVVVRDPACLARINGGLGWSMFKFLPVYPWAGQARNMSMISRDIGGRFSELAAFSLKAYALSRGGLKPGRKDKEQFATLWRQLFGGDGVEFSQETNERVCAGISDVCCPAIDAAVKAAHKTYPAAFGGTALGRSARARRGAPASAALGNPRALNFDRDAALAMVERCEGATANWAHYQPVLFMKDGSKYIFDWWMTLKPENPAIWRYQDWMSMPQLPDDIGAKSIPAFLMRLQLWAAKSRPLKPMLGLPAFTGL